MRIPPDRDTSKTGQRPRFTGSQPLQEFFGVFSSFFGYLIRIEGPGINAILLTKGNVYSKGVTILDPSPTPSSKTFWNARAQKRSGRSLIASVSPPDRLRLSLPYPKKAFAISNRLPCRHEGRLSWLEVCRFLKVLYEKFYILFGLALKTALNGSKLT